uniref:Uncharacterized protein n=1 Tax=Avena sativa TaxID=4498 RepID=A0ACD5XLI3_AVESA
MKLVHRLHANADAPWPRWVWTSVVTDQCRHPSKFQGHRRLGLLPLYRSLSLCIPGDGRRTSFWWDNWLGGSPLGCQFSALLSHALDKEVSLRHVLAVGLRATLVPRLNNAGEQQLAHLSVLLADCSLTEAPDRWELRRCAKANGQLDAAALYRLCTWGGVSAPFHNFVWTNWAPSKVQFFAWLLVQARVQSRSALVKKNILWTEDGFCPCCAHPSEDANHLFFGCPLVKRFWAAIGCTLPALPVVNDLPHYCHLVQMPPATASTFLLLCLWNIWKHRNGVVFRGLPPASVSFSEAVRMMLFFGALGCPRSMPRTSTSGCSVCTRVLHDVPPVLLSPPSLLVNNTTSWVFSYK